VKDVLELGKKDPSPQVQEWADNFLKQAAGAKPEAKPDPQADIADIPFQDLHAGADENKRFFLIGPRPGAKKPEAGYRLVLVLPGGDGSADFRPFIQRVLKNALPDDVVIAQLVAPKWTDAQDRIVWPTKGLKDDKMKFATEDFVTAVLDDVKGRVTIDPKRIDALGWSSGGPPVYAISLNQPSPLRGAFVAMSVFKPESLPPVAGASGHRYYILHSPDDFIPMTFPKDAEEKLRQAGAKTKLVTYPGGHGWRGDVFGTIRAGFEWLDKTGE
jgi:predicted esterase